MTDQGAVNGIVRDAQGWLRIAAELQHVPDASHALRMVAQAYETCAADVMRTIEFHRSHQAITQPGRDTPK